MAAILRFSMLVVLIVVSYQLGNAMQPGVRPDSEFLKIVFGSMFMALMLTALTIVARGIYILSRWIITGKMIKFFG